MRRIVNQTRQVRMGLSAPLALRHRVKNRKNHPPSKTAHEPEENHVEEAFHPNDESGIAGDEASD